MTVFLLCCTAFAGAAVSLYAFWYFSFGRNYSFPSQVLTYHHIHGGPGLLATRTSRASLEKQLHALKERNIRSLSPGEFFAQRKGEGKGSILITFDDCYATVADSALPLLASVGYTASLFVISDYIGRPNTWDVRLSHATHMTEEHIRKAIARGFTIGSHTKTHRDLTALSPDELTEELLGSRRRLEETFGIQVKYLAYPFGRYNYRVKEAARACGYEGAFTINRPICQRARDPFAVPANGIYMTDTLSNFLSKATRDRFVWIDDLKCKIINRFADGALLVKGRRSV
ncbi:MAG: hypothetical protein A2487_06185 [Candidatus Raymondbacteria bacterium RifOxyC12_full_50_8]|uniref:NodB homology domain-containing protein n=1 Tax=Candidatus Raymondbacteria bacterium RIFOXYD12_FULL_49_13 TaxID=1817890 RepID=A0A1F7F9C6_UNCRA|nr:MAG: hypothetical protein A2248_18560 [Candidatus Raymondbacteria bacterium RIFOXYA2_FULL_49_16]OGJ98607.1 MAG: hypothetical protein A2350_14225 [Candidatus Raymondbacteria bacterium RifOxyB12_full_50_8]OGJ99490.1 MAG: hypothetical protein A2487_06185 [Candidatus Raymondbacteria bacterium RifOxyC12_full_50_8]OGK03279.1 MAG: hypothetical protein A2519_13205 [Candidatus Raymondbacteria bacterium RIFOXYD12_FULL_49_13]OGP41552.1 MAG: hypothetical protein A2324_09725 [Candidatus Raymondbacteria b